MNLFFVYIVQYYATFSQHTSAHWQDSDATIWTSGFQKNSLLLTALPIGQLSKLKMNQNNTKMLTSLKMFPCRCDFLQPKGQKEYNGTILLITCENYQHWIPWTQVRNGLYSHAGSLRNPDYCNLLPGNSVQHIDLTLLFHPHVRHMFFSSVSLSFATPLSTKWQGFHTGKDSVR